MDRNIRKLWLILVIVGFCFFPLHETIAADCTETFSWLPNAELNITRYEIHYGLTNGGPYPNVVNVGKPETVDGRIYGQVTGLTCGQQYYFVSMVFDDAGGKSEYSDQVELTTAEVLYDEIEPETVTGLQSPTHSIGECSSNPEIAVQWIAAVDTGGSGLDGYSMIWDTESDTLPDTTKDMEDVTTVTSSSLSAGNYYFHIRSVDNALNWSNTAEHLGPFCIDTAVPSDPNANVYTITFGDISGADFPQTCKDTYLNAGEAEVNYSSNSESLNTYTWPTNTAANRIVMKWDFSSALPQNAIIQEATLSLYMHGFSGTGGDDNHEITAHKIINHNPDISSCTWNTYDGSNSWTGGANGGEQNIASAESSTIVNKTSGYKNWDITKMVQEWVSNSSTNFGLMLNSDTTAASDSNRYFRPSENSNQDQRPVLTIKYYGSDIPKVPSAPLGLTVDD